MSAEDNVKKVFYDQGRAMAMKVQEKAPKLTGTELNAESDFIPDFKESVKVKNMLNRKAGIKDGFVCKSSAGRVVRLIQAYDSTIFIAEPEELPAQWGFVWSTDPAKALPFIALSTSPYGKNDCCTHNGKIWRSTNNNNVTEPGTVGALWEVVTTHGHAI